MKWTFTNGSTIVFTPPKKRDKNKIPQSGIMCKVFAYDGPGGALLGSGWVIYYSDGKFSHPDLFDIKGEKLPEGWYTLRVTDETKLVVIPRMVQ